MQTKLLIILPTYNNEKTLLKVLHALLALKVAPVLVVNDGSTDQTATLLSEIDDPLFHLISYPKNRGKGYALRQAFKSELASQYDYAITLDSDGQHYPEDVLKLKAYYESLETPSLILGARDLEGAGAPTKSSFGNKFSNFWFWAETAHKVPDTQTGFRAYPLQAIRKMHFWGTKFEFEVEVIVKLAWKGIPVHSLPVKVKYDPEERVSHFRPFKDFTRISILNTYLFSRAIIWEHPKRLIWKGDLWRVLKEETFKTHESKQKKAFSIAIGMAIGVMPLWGFQMLIVFGLSVLLKFNKVLSLAASNISIPPMIPLIVFLSFLLGAPFVNEAGVVAFERLMDVSLEAIELNVKQYVIGAFLLSGILFVLAYFSALIMIPKQKNV